MTVILTSSIKLRKFALHIAPCIWTLTSIVQQITLKLI